MLIMVIYKVLYTSKYKNEYNIKFKSASANLTRQQSTTQIKIKVRSQLGMKHEF